MIAHSPPFLVTLGRIDRAAPVDVPVLIEGEAGTVKELAARAIPCKSERRDQPHFVPVNCGALPKTMNANELFGHRGDAFIDALTEWPSLHRLARRG